VGRPIGATVLYDNGVTRRFDDIGAALGEVDGGRVEFHYSYGPTALPAVPTGAFDMWRYWSLLPLEDTPITYPLSVGGTPLIAPPGLRKEMGIPKLWLKDETRGPTGSNKDRATALVLQHALNAGVATISCSSTGNTAVSLAVGAAATGQQAVIFVPAGVMESKVRLMLAAGATVLKVTDDYAATARLSRQAAAAFGWYDRNTGVNPLTLEAKKTVAFEVWEQLGREAPDVVIVPVGDGPTLNGVAKGFRELVECGVSRAVPRIVGVQAEGCQPIRRAWQTNSPVRAVQPATVADGIAVGVPISGAMAIRDVRQSGGGFVAVSDAEILDAVRMLATRAGVLAEPAGAAAFAAIQRAVAEGLVGRDERVVVLVTGSALKTPQFLNPSKGLLEVGANLDEVQRAASFLR
jgi:threonine synthase